MSKRSIRGYVLRDLFEELGVKLTDEQSEHAEDIADDFAGHIEMEREQESYQFIGPVSCSDCKAKDKRIEKLENELRIYEQEIIRRAKMPEDSYIEMFGSCLEIKEPMR